MSRFPVIDAVIAWVDGSDPAHRARREAAIAADGGKAPADSTVASDTRFSDMGEIYFCVASILKYAPFIRTIHVVTDNQSPRLIDRFAAEGICAPDRIRIVDHREIFRGYETFLPSFSARAIEAMLWRIGGLADWYIYFNDDFFINAPLAPESLMTPDGKVILNGTMSSVYPVLVKHTLRETFARGPVRPRYTTSVMKSARHAGLHRYMDLGHHPHLIARKTLATFFESRPGTIREQIQPKFRSSRQFNPAGLANHLEIAQGRAVFGPARNDLILKPGMATPENLAAIETEAVTFGCVQNLDLFPQDQQAALRTVLTRKFRDMLPAELATLADAPDKAPSVALPDAGRVVGPEGLEPPTKAL